jgi:predicted transcriptional regulator
MELTYEEARSLASALGKEKQVKLSKVMQQLTESGFFHDPRSFADIREKLQTYGIRVRSASLHVLVTNLVERGILVREGTRRSFTYTKPLVTRVT